MSKKYFQQGLKFYQTGNLQQALDYFNKSIDNDSSPNYMVLDTRSATYAKLGQTKEALKDAKKTIEVAPERWQGYGRAAQLFLDLKKADASITMVRVALSKLSEKDTERRASLLSLEAKALKAQADIEQRRRRFSDHMGYLPIELFGEIARLVVESNHTSVIGLSQVSKHWRSVIHNSPYLWKVLILNHRRPKQKAKLWIERSKGKLHELAIRPGAIDTPNWPGDSLKGFRWEELRVLRLHSWDLRGYLLSIQVSDTVLGYLEHLDVTNSITWEAILPPNNIALQHLALRHINISSQTFTNITSNAENLKALTLEKSRLAGTTLFDLLGTIPSIEILVLHEINAAPLSNDVALSCLTSLDIKGFSASSLSLSDLPELRILRLEAVHVARQLLEVVKKTSPHLTELVLRSCAVPPQLVIGVLQNSVDLQMLEVSNSEASQIAEFLAASHSIFPSPNGDNPSPAPTGPVVRCSNLQHVNFSRCGDIQTGPIVRMIKARLSISNPPSAQTQVPIQRITTLVIDECQHVDSAWLPWIRQHVQSVSCVYMKKKAKFRA